MLPGVTTMLCVVPTTFVPSLHEYVYPVPALALNVVDVPAQMVVALAVIVAVGAFTTFTVTASVFTQPFASVPVTVYVVVLDGVAVTIAVFVTFKPVDGLHEYVDAPLAVNVVLDPAQIVASNPAFTTGN